MIRSLLFFVAVSGGIAPGALACACAPHQLNEDVDKTGVIYFARLIAARDIEPTPDDILGHYEVTFKITETLKGHPGSVGDMRDLLFLRCAVELVIGDEYVVFEREPCRTTRCWGTDHFDRSDWKADDRRRQKIRDEIERQSRR